MLPAPEPAVQEVQQPAAPDAAMWVAAMRGVNGPLELDLAPGAAALVQEHTQATRDVAAQMEAMMQQMQRMVELQVRECTWSAGWAVSTCLSTCLVGHMFVWQV